MYALNEFVNLDWLVLELVCLCARSITLHSVHKIYCMYNMCTANVQAVNEPANLDWLVAELEVFDKVLHFHLYIFKYTCIYIYI